MLSKGAKKAINTAVPKATRSGSMKAPKEKHVKALIQATMTQDPMVMEEITRCLAKRLEKDNWVVVLKTLMVFHRLFREGELTFIETLKTRSTAIFALKRFQLTAPPGNIFTLFVQKYAKYLEENVSVLRLIGFPFERSRDCLKNLAPKEAFKRVPKLQSQLNALLNCKMKQHHIGRNALVISTYMLLLKDSLILYPMLNDGVIGLIDLCFKMKKKDAQKVLEIYTLFVRETQALINLYDISRSFTSRLPPIHPAKETLIEALSTHINKMEDTEGGEVFSEDAEAAGDIEPEPDMAEYSANPASPSGPHDEDEDSDTSSESSDEDHHGNGNGIFGTPESVSPTGSNGNSTKKGSSNGQNNTPTLNHTDSWAFLASQQQPMQTTSSGWELFDRPSSSNNQNVFSFGNNNNADPFAAFAASNNGPSSSGGILQPTSIESIPYNQRADAVKSSMSQHFMAAQQQQQQHQNTQIAYDNPFAVPAAQPTQPDNPFAIVAKPTPASPTPAAPTNANYNPFL